ncbi:hypothetical protein HZU83_05855 [Sphaerotilus montanus]|jgi:uncharacterized protein|uniref:Uncharacterized protein n=1 Tax=Sphaerotilus montanus TaxID=522889 RepID=A0A7Y9QZR4_9BURK|nr:PP0621 family protein [Sphaerotilus montanus]NYG32934.1 uncharacterized protein [Sphaerotilus montanus]NZD56198.1 hypothetical protein [Sphaerotilus montanus]
MKLLLILLTVLAIVWLLRAARRVPPPPDRNDVSPEPTGRAVQTLARCAHCGMHLTSADSEQRDGQAYCCAAHRRAGPRAPFGRR